MLVILISPERKTTDTFYLKLLKHVSCETILMIFKVKNQVLVKYIFIFAVHLFFQHIRIVE